MMTYQVYVIPKNVNSAIEQRGTKEKFWFTHPEDGHQYLFKVGREATGENWAEKIACELSYALDIPHAQYQLASYNGVQGVITKNFVPKGGRLTLGNELLSKRIKGYQDGQNYKTRQHTFRLVQTYLSAKDLGILTPFGWVPPEDSFVQVDVFTGYLMLDVLISNQDRHHENWGLVINDDLHLTPTFDHGASLGMNETDETRRKRLTTKDRGNSVDQYVRRARSALYQTTSSKKPLKTYDAFEVAARTNPRGAAHWLNKLMELTDQQINDIVWNIPPEVAGEIEKEFAAAIIVANRNRLLELKQELNL